MQPSIMEMKTLRRLVIDKLARNLDEKAWSHRNQAKPSAVLCIMGHDKTTGPYFILTKRSSTVPQPGDLSFPGGGPRPVQDALIAKLLHLPQMPLFRWPYRNKMAQNTPKLYQSLKTRLATSLRESFEEIRLAPFHVDFLGTLLPQNLLMFKRTIFPMVGLLRRPVRFKANGEVAAIMPISLAYLLNADNYANYRLQYSASVASRLNQKGKEFPCLVFEHKGQRQILWGVTFRIVMALLEQVFEFTPPDLDGLPEISGRIGKSYYNHESKRLV